MLEKILEYEHDLFFALNGSDSVFLDRFMWLYSGQKVWIPLIVFLVIVLLYKKGWKESIFIVLAIALVITLCDQFASGFCKTYFLRFRPTHHPDFMNEVHTVFGQRGGKYGFISSHAANAFGFATYMVYLFRHTLFTISIYVWATLTAYSRIYLGMHFISDIVPGILAGILFGYIVYRIYKWSRARIIARSEEERAVSALYTRKQKLLVTGSIIVTVIIILVLNAPLVALLRG